MQALYARIIDLRAAVQKEWMETATLKLSPEYQALDERIAALNVMIAEAQDAQRAMLSTVPDSRGALEEAKTELFELMKIEGKEVYGEAKMKYSNKSEVNKVRLLHELQGDLDRYVTLSNVTQSALKDYAKESGHTSLLSCIETVSTPVGVEFPNP